MSVRLCKLVLNVHSHFVHKGVVAAYYISFHSKGMLQRFSVYGSVITFGYREINDGAMMIMGALQSWQLTVFF